MKKLFLLFIFTILTLAVKAQSEFWEGTITGYPPANMATIDSIKYDAVNNYLVFYRGGVATLTYGGIYDHGLLDAGSLGDDDHPHYYNAARLNAWTGSTSITTTGIITNGTWRGTSIADAYIPNTITLNNITQIASRSHTDLQDIGTLTHADLDDTVTYFTTTLAGLTVATDSVFETITAHDTIFFGSAALNKLYEVGTLAYFEVQDYTSVIFGTGSATGGDLWLGDSINFKLGTAQQVTVDGSGSLRFKDPNAGSYTLSQLVAAAVPGLDSVSYAYTLCTANSTTNITIGDTSDVSFKMIYMAFREMSVVDQRLGELTVMYNDVNDSVYYTSDHVGEDLGLSITADKSGTNIRLNVAVDNTNANDLLFGISNIQTGTTVYFETMDTISLGDAAPLLQDTVPFFVFIGGAGEAGDTIFFDNGDDTFGSINNPIDTTVIINVDMLKLRETTSTCKVNWYIGNAHTGVARDSLFTSPQTINTSTTTLTPNNETKMRPGEDLWMEMAGAQTPGSKPNELNIQVNRKILRD